MRTTLVILLVVIVIAVAVYFGYKATSKGSVADQVSGLAVQMGWQASDIAALQHVLSIAPLADQQILLYLMQGFQSGNINSSMFAQNLNYISSKYNIFN